jgi:DNA-binding MarR family transcriptional regulator
MLYNSYGLQTSTAMSNRENLSMADVEERCRTCSISNPMACKEVCEIWKLKQEYSTLKKEAPVKPNAATVLYAAADPLNSRILHVLVDRSARIEDLKLILEKNYGAVAFEDRLDRLVNVGLLGNREREYYVTTAGKKAIDSIQQYEGLRLKNIDSTNEEILRLLSESESNISEMSRVLPKTQLRKALENLRAYGVVEKITGGNQVLYFATKRRPTRRLSPTELEVFKSLPRKGASPQEISHRLSITLPSVYRYLRLLRYKRHAVRRKQEMTFALTPVGKQIVEALKKVQRFMDALSPSDFA